VGRARAHRHRHRTARHSRALRAWLSWPISCSEHVPV
jgi:hypothetical protein